MAPEWSLNDWRTAEFADYEPNRLLALLHRAPVAMNSEANQGGKATPKNAQAASFTSNEVVTAAVLASMTEAEQYFS